MIHKFIYRYAFAEVFFFIKARKIVCAPSPPSSRVALYASVYLIRLLKDKSFWNDNKLFIMGGKVNGRVWWLVEHKNSEAYKSGHIKRYDGVSKTVEKIKG